MATRTRLFGTLFIAGALGCALLLTPARVQAQEIQDVHNPIHPLGTQVGVVTTFSNHSAWIRLPQRSKVGDKVELLPYSDAIRPQASGTIEWVSPIPPYDAYVTKIEVIKHKYPVNDNDDIFAISTVFNTTYTVDPQPHENGFGGYMGANYFARTKAYNFAEEEDGKNPVTALVAELRKRKNKTAQTLADAAEKCAERDASSIPPSDPDDAIATPDYSKLFKAVKPFRALKGMDTVTAHILNQLYLLARNNNPTDSLPAGLLNTSRTGGGAAAAPVPVPSAPTLGP